MSTQLDFFQIPIEGELWIIVSGHKVIADGTRCLVVREDHDHYLCWEGGTPPPKGVNGTLIHKNYCKIEEDEA